MRLVRSCPTGLQLHLFNELPFGTAACVGHKGSYGLPLGQTTRFDEHAVLYVEHGEKT